MTNILSRMIFFILPCAENKYRPSILNGRFFSYLALILIFAKFITVFYLIYIPTTPFFSDIATGVLLKMTNEERAFAGRAPLTVNQKLNQAALMKANDMIENDYFSHWSPQGRSPWYWFDLAGYNYQYAGENLAIGFFDATEVHRAWINSSSHRENILSPGYQEIGMAVVRKEEMGRSTFLVVQMFGSPKREIPRETVSEVIATYPEPQPVEKAEEIDIDDSLIVDDSDQDLLKEIEDEEEFVPDEEEFVPDEEDVADEEEEQTILGDYDTGVYLQSVRPIEKVSFSFMQFLLLEYDDFIQKVVLLSLMFLGFILIVNVFIRFDVQHPDLIFKGLAFLVIFLIFEHLNQETIVQIMIGNPIIGY